MSDTMNQEFLTNLANRARRPCAPESLAVFRIGLGLSVAWFAWSTLTSASLDVDYIRPAIHLTYFGFDWVRPWPGNGMTLHFVALLFSAVCFALGLGYRLAAVVMWLTFTHVFLIERALYNNHYYLVVLLSFLSTFLPLDRACSLDALRLERSNHFVPAWTIWLLRFQLGVVYFYGGLAKLDADWLRGQPMRMWLAKKQALPVLGPWLTEEWVVQLFAWGGLAIDLGAVPGLMWRRTRGLTFAVLILFHLLNSQLFTIGFFPWLMIAASTLFFEPDWPRRLLFLPSLTAPETCAADYRPLPGRFGCALLGLYVAVQLLVPLRHHLYPGNPNWTEEGQLFAWRMMLRQKLTAVRFHASDPHSGREGVLDVRPYLNLRQATQMSRNPELIVQFAQKLAALHARNGTPDLQIQAKVLASLNGRKPQLLIDPEVDLTKQPLGWRPASCIMPLTEPYRAKAWDVPVARWEQELATPQSPDSGSTFSGPRGGKDDSAASLAGFQHSTANHP